jgi:hypothetical protein
VEQAVHSRLERPALLDLPPDPVSSEPHPPGEVYGLFHRATVDLRRYNRVDPVSRLNFRLLAGGALDGDALPPQLQYALGGTGTLPGYPLFSRDCGARAATGYRATDPAGKDAHPFYAAYGCDAFALFQAEFRGKLSLRFRWDGAPWRDDDEEEGIGWGLGWDFAPEWAVFVDAGRGWGYDGRPDEPVAVDAGVGVLVERFGIYFATPLSGGSGINVFIRLGPRF